MHTAGQYAASSPLGWWFPERTVPSTDIASLRPILGDLKRPVIFVRTPKGSEIAVGGNGSYAVPSNGSEGLPIVAYLPATALENLGDSSFRADHGLRYAYLAGAMANGIASVEIVEAMSRAGMLGFFGAAGLSLERIDTAIGRLQASLGERPHGFNLIHSPNEPDHEAATVELFIKRGVRLIEASAYLKLTPPVVRYRLHGIHRRPDGKIVTPNRIIAKVSRIEVATRFFSPAPEAILRELLEKGQITAEQAELAKQVPIAQDLTAEADSGGHTDNRPAITLLPILISCRDQLQKQYGYEQPLRVGLGGGIATPAAVAAAFAMGAAYVLTGSINQACVESGSSDLVRSMLAEAEQADVAMAPAADMFEMGVKVQVLKRGGTMFPMRATKLYELYKGYPSIEALPPAERANLEKNFFRTSLDEIWNQTREFFRKRDPQQVTRAEAEPKHRMALIFRWYLGHSSRWANAGEADRKIDFQVWCGPAMGAYNEWTKGSYLQDVRNRKVADVARSLLYGAAVLGRLNQARAQGIELPREAFPIEPIEPAAWTRATGDGE
ncbi:MAG: PfaD family polyunsaturated fatty acid/polyketide biosynthesis protein [Planctomycetes bacterium]|nr:PfaD family polyunsaturated fatty acid/polyketide biosynthesis protein [Planctomycetota bacterium]